MPKFWLDADVFIEAANGPFGFDIGPGFWEMIDTAAKEGLCCSPRMVYDEILRKHPKENALAQWAKSRKSGGLFVDADKDVTEAYTTVADHAKGNYEDAEASVFLSGADPWIIAHALQASATVVTRETRANSSAKRVKIPNVCITMKVPCINTYEMMRRIKARLVLKK